MIVLIFGLAQLIATTLYKNTVQLKEEIMRLILALGGYAMAGVAVAAWATGDTALAAYLLFTAVATWAVLL